MIHVTSLFPGRVFFLLHAISLEPSIQWSWAHKQIVELERLLPLQDIHLRSAPVPCWPDLLVLSHEKFSGQGLPFGLLQPSQRS